jgi:glycosyltransferase involved in cell wall biosynthesis/tetratricopeptide (TPR) repeat protein
MFDELLRTTAKDEKSEELREKAKQQEELRRKAKEKKEAAARAEARQLFKLLCRQAEADAQHFQEVGDLAAALAVYDDLFVEVRQHPKIVAKRTRIVRLLRNRARHLQGTGDLRAALAVYDALPAAIREAEFRQDREDILGLLLKQTAKEAGQFFRTGDAAAVLALYDSLPAELLERLDVVQERSALVRRCAQRAAHQLRKTSDFAGALAVYDRLPAEFRDHVDILQDRGHIFHCLGQLNAAREAFSKVLSADPGREELWFTLGIILADLGRSKELETHIEDMISKLPPTFDLLCKAARLAKRGMLLHLSGKLLDDALTFAPSGSASAIVKTAEALLQQGAQGRVIGLLGSEQVRSDPNFRSHARDLSNQALDQLRLAGRPSEAGPVAETERADLLVVRSILEQAGNVTPTVAPAQRGIAVVTNSGGAQKQVVELIRQLCVAHRELIGPIFLLVEGRSSDAPKFFESRLAGLDVTIEFISEIEVDRQNVLPAGIVEKLNLLPPKLFNAVVPLASRLKQHNPEVVLVMMTLRSLPAVLAASITEIPHIVTSEGSEPRRPDELLKLAYRTVIARNSASLATNSAATARGFAKWLDVPSERVRVIYNGVNVDELRAQRDPATVAAYRRSLGIADGTRIVGSVFQARMAKRPQLWIEAAAVIAKRAYDVAFIVVGGKMDRDDLSAMIVRHGLESRFHRPGITTDVANWLELMDLVLLTSQYEGTPNVLLEAQALGRPVVATDVGGNAETFLPGETGLLIPAHPAPEQVADAVVRVLDDPTFAARAAEKGPKFIRGRFGSERMAAEFVDLCFGKSGSEPGIVPAPCIENFIRIDQ